MMERMQIVKRSRACRGRVMGSALLLWLSTAAVLSAQTTIVRPTEIDDVLVNPGMGIETFQRFSGQPINEGVKWSEVGPETSTAHPNAAVDFPDSSVAYLRWFWSQIEPERGTYRWSILDDALADAHRHGQRLAIRIMPYDDKHAMPDWYVNSGAKRANTAADKDGTIWSPDADDPIYAKAWSALVIEAGQALRRPSGSESRGRLDGRLLGRRLGTLPSQLVRFSRQLIDVYFTAFSTYAAADELRCAAGAPVPA